MGKCSNVNWLRAVVQQTLCKTQLLCSPAELLPLCMRFSVLLLVVGAQRVEKVLDQSLLRLAQRVESLQQEIRVLRGELETVNNKLEVQQKRNRDLYRDTDQRLVELETKVDTLNQPLGPDGLPLDGSEPRLLLDETADGGGGETSDAENALGGSDSSTNSAQSVSSSPGVFVAQNPTAG